MMISFKHIVGLFILILAVHSITLKNQKMYDSQGRQIYFHGTNVVVKVPPYIPILDTFNADFSFSQEDMANCQKWGINAIRLGVMWAGVQPQKDTYNQTYLQKMKQLVITAGQKYGIYSIIDFHQDILSQKFCGDGVPAWLIDQLKGYKSFPFPIQMKKFKLNDTKLPDWDDCLKHNWGQYYFSLDVGKQFRNLYTTGHHLNKKFTSYWEKLAQTFKGNPWVLAYQFINQPFVGRALEQPYLILPSVAERVYFQNFYDQLTQKIRKIDNETPICFQPITFDQIVPVGFTHPPGGFSQKDKSILCYHYYRPPDRNIKTIDYRVRDAKRLKVASMLDQFGMWDGPQVMQRAQKYHQSWFFWQYKDFGKTWGTSYQRYIKPYLSQQNQNLGSGMYDKDGNINKAVVKKLSRTYFQNIAGKLLQSTYTDATSQFEATYEAAPKGTTRLYFNQEYNYPSGVNIQVYPSTSNLKLQKKENIFEITNFENSNIIIMVKLTHLK